MNVTLVMLGISLIIFFGFFAEFIFKKTKIPDTLALVLLGFLLGPSGLGYINPESIYQFAPIFTTFTLIFILFDGAFSLDIISLFKELPYSLVETLVNFFVSTSVIAIIMIFYGFSTPISIMTGFMLGGISSSFVIPLLKGLGIRKNSYSLLTLEAAMTDVLCIVFSIAMMEFIKLKSMSVPGILMRIVSLFGVAAVVGVVGGIVWIILVAHFFKEHKTYMDTIAFVILIYVIAEFLHGNGALASLFFGLMLKNSKLITSLVRTKHIKFGVNVMKPRERLFYDQITFFIKTFFFVYIGMLFDISNVEALIIGTIISISLMIIRNISSTILNNLATKDKVLLNSVFGRGIAAAALAQMAIQMGIQNAEAVESIIYVVIVETIVLSSIKVFVTSKVQETPPVRVAKITSSF